MPAPSAGASQSFSVAVRSRIASSGPLHRSLTRWWTTWLGGNPVFNRDLHATPPYGVGSFNVYHPATQEALLALAEKAGVEIRRGINVESVIPGNPPSIRFQDQGKTTSLRARIIVGADGRNSHTRSSVGFLVNRDPDRLMIAGLLLEGVSAPEDATHHGVGSDAA